MVNSRAKGARGEREWAQYLRENWGFHGARRGRQYHGGPGSPDVVGGIESTHCEVKRVEQLSVYKALEQSKGEAAVEEIPYVAYRRNNMPWVVMVYADDLPRLALALSDEITGRDLVGTLHG